MIKRLIKHGNSDVLVITKEMRAHLGLENGTVKVEFYGGRVIVTKPCPQTGIDATETHYITAARNLGR